MRLSGWKISSTSLSCFTFISLPSLSLFPLITFHFRPFLFLFRPFLFHTVPAGIPLNQFKPRPWQHKICNWCWKAHIHCMKTASCTRRLYILFYSVQCHTCAIVDIRNCSWRRRRTRADASDAYQNYADDQAQFSAHLYGKQTTLGQERRPKNTAKCHFPETYDADVFTFQLWTLTPDAIWADVT